MQDWADLATERGERIAELEAQLLAAIDQELAE
jgi:hypothetical protein